MNRGIFMTPGREEEWTLSVTHTDEAVDHYVAGVRRDGARPDRVARSGRPRERSYNRRMGDAAVHAIGRRPEVVGREAEQARIDAFLAVLTQGARSLMIRGEPGIGKTTLWRQATESARRAGYVVLVARASEEEMSLALGGLVDLFEDLEIDAAALLAESNPFTRGRAVLEAIRSCAESSPVVIAIDDVPWFDSVSARALRYALRRLDAEPVGVLATARPDLEPEDPLATAGSLPPSRAETLDLEPLDLDALRRVLGGTVETISRPLLKRIHEVSGGNPLYAIELARGIRVDALTDRASGTLQLPDSLQAAIAQRLETVPGDVTRLLETTSALGAPTVKELRETLAGSDVDGLARGYRARRTARRGHGSPCSLCAPADPFCRLRTHEPARSALASCGARRTSC